MITNRYMFLFTTCRSSVQVDCGTAQPLVVSHSHVGHKRATRIDICLGTRSSRLGRKRGKVFNRVRYLIPTGSIIIEAIIAAAHISWPVSPIGCLTALMDRLNPPEKKELTERIDQKNILLGGYLFFDGIQIRFFRKVPSEKHLTCIPEADDWLRQTPSPEYSLSPFVIALSLVVPLALLRGIA